MFKKIILFFSLVIVFTACQNRPLQQLGATAISQKVDKYKLEGGGNVTVDILFVIDNSGSMAEEQEKVAENIENFMKMLKISADDGKTDYHIGIITTSVYDKDQTSGDPNNVKQIMDNEDGRLLRIKSDVSCTKLNKRYLDISDNNNVVDLLKNTIKCIGVDGAGIERGLDAIKKALSDKRTTGENVGFLRPKAKLMIIVIGDEDDCSTGLRAYNPTTGEPDTNKPFPITRGRDCVEQHDSIPEATDHIATGSSDDKNIQNKVKPIKDYYDFLLEKKGGNSALLGFAAIVGPLNCWTGEINDMGQGAQTQDPSIPFSFQNCRYTSEVLSQRMYDINFSTCDAGIIKTCSCSAEDTSIEACDRDGDLLTTCYNNIAGTPNKLPVVSEHPCSEHYLHGHCKTSENDLDLTQHCEVTDRGVKCVDNTCSAANPNGTCKASQYCASGACIDKVAAAYADRTSKSAPGKRFLELQKLIANGNAPDSYKYSICLEDFGTPLSLIGARLADAKCEYNLINKTDAPCTVAINIFSPEDKNLENGIGTNLNSPWIYTTLDDCSHLTGDLNTICEANKTRTFAEKGDELVRICKENLDKPFSERINISELLETVNCGELGEGSKECLKILFPEGNACPQPGSNVEIYYGVNE